MQSLIALVIISIHLLLLPSCLVFSWRIEKGGTITASVASSAQQHQQQQSWQQQELRRTTPPNTADPDYFHPTSTGGRSQHPGHDGAVVFIAQVQTTNPTPFETVHVPPLELRAHYFGKENVMQQYVVPGDGERRPYEQEVRVKVWGAGGGGCDGGRGETTEPIPEEEHGIIKFSEGSGGGYVEATFTLPVGNTLQIVVGGGGMSQGSLPDSLGGKGGYNGGYPGRSDEMSGGGGGGGLTTVSWNGTIIAAAYGGRGGGNTTYCTALGGVGATLRGEPKDTGGYINFDLASSDDDDLQEEVTPTSCPGMPTIVMRSHDSAKFTWNAGSHQNERSKEFYVQKYTVQLSEGSLIDDEVDIEGIACSDDYKLHEHIQRSFYITQNATTHVENLRASTPYCIRIEAFSIEGLILGVQVLPFTTKATPINQWLPVMVREPQVSTISEKANVVVMNDNSISQTKTNHNGESTASTSWCQHSSSRPTGRRGHSMTIVNDQVYIFGGATLKCVCEYYDDTTLQEDKKRCSSKNVHSNELWHFDPLTAMFTHLERGSEKEELWPRGREQHSATALPNGNIIIIGGLSTTTSSSNNNNNNSNDYDLEIGQDSSELLLADVWRMRDPHHISSHMFRSNNDERMPLELIPGHITSARFSIDDDEEGESGQDMMCIADIQVKILLDHSCLKGIEYIKLTGPGTKNVTDHDAPQSRDYEAKIFVSSMDSRENECHSSSLDLLFSDNAEESILSYASIPTSGTFRPASSLMATFGGLPLNGEWKISISLSQPIYPEEHHSSLLEWELKIDAKPCVARTAKWEKLLPTIMSSSTSSFSPRRLHTAVAVDNSIFVAGGFAERRLNDLWRFDYDSNTWTELNSAAAASLRGGQKTWPLNGQVTFLGQYGLLAFGGIAKYGPLKQGHDLWLLDLFGDDWVSVPIPQKNTSAHGGGDGYFNNDIPYGRYLSSMGFLNNVDAIYKSHSLNGKSGPMALVFGGDGGLLHNTYADSYGFVPNSFFDDVWLLSPGGIDVSSSMNQRRREEYCNWRFLESSTSFQSWNNTCGWGTSMDGSPGECRLESILIVAWCKEQYQSLWMS